MGLELAQHGGQRLLLLEAQAGSRLVEQQQRRVGGQRTRDLDHALRAERQVAGRLKHAIGQADAFELALRLGKQLALFGAVAPEHRAQRALTRTQVAADSNVLEHRHLRDQLHVLKGAREPAPRDLARRQAIDALAAKVHFAAAQRQQTRYEVEGGALAGAVGADQADDLAGAHTEAHVVDGEQAAKGFAHGFGLKQQVTGGRLVTRGQRGGALPVGAQGDYWQQSRQGVARARPHTVWRVLQRQHQRDAKDDHFVVATRPDQPGQPDLELVFDQLHHAGPGERAPHVAHPADHRHEQVLDAHLDAEGRWIHGALKVREQPARHRCVLRRDDEDDDLVAIGTDAHRLGHHAAALERADRTAGARVEQVDQRPGTEQRQRPDQVINAAALVEIDAKQVERRHAEQAVVLAQRLGVGHRVVDRQAPGDGRQRQVVTAHAQRQPTEQQRRRQREREADPQVEPR